MPRIAIAIAAITAPTTNRMNAAAHGLPNSPPSRPFQAAMTGMPMPVANMRSESIKPEADIALHRWNDAAMVEAAAAARNSAAPVIQPVFVASRSISGFGFGSA